MKKSYKTNFKSNTHFKGVIQKMLISSLVLTSVLGTSSAAFAAENDRVDMPKLDMSAARVVAYENGISVETALQEIKTTISKLKLQVSGGFVQTETLEKLASQLSQLEKSANGQSSSKIVSTLDSVESVVKGISGNEKVMVALQSVRDSLGIVSVTEDVKAPKTNAGVDFADKGEIPSWALDSITEMSNIGLINGKPTENGAIFDANGTMTRAEYVNIAVKTLYKDELQALINSGAKTTNWWDNAFTVAKQHGILLENDPNFSDKAGEGISREEMALILIRVAHDKGISTDKWVYQSQIPDFKDVSPYYQGSVRECYTLGLLNGTDSKGTFAPKGTLNRASAAQTFYKLLHADKRTPVAPEKPSYNQSTEVYKPAAELQTFKEGEAHTIPQEGDTVIAKDGRTVVLSMNQVGDSDLYLLGWGQGVDIITGTKPNANSDALVELGNGSWEDGSPFCDNKVNNEVYSKMQWAKISAALGEPKEDGKYEGEIRNIYYQWDTVAESWIWLGGA